MTDPVNAPSHYTRLSPQPIEVIEAWGMDFHLANTLKYIARAGYKDKDKELEDLKKARFYLDRRIALVEKELQTTSNAPYLDQLEDVKPTAEFHVDRMVSRHICIEQAEDTGAMFKEPAVIQISSILRHKIMPDGVTLREQLVDGEWSVVGVIPHG